MLLRVEYGQHGISCGGPFHGGISLITINHQRHNLPNNNTPTTLFCLRTNFVNCPPNQLRYLTLHLLAIKPIKHDKVRFAIAGRGQRKHLPMFFIFSEFLVPLPSSPLATVVLICTEMPFELLCCKLKWPASELRHYRPTSHYPWIPCHVYRPGGWYFRSHCIVTATQLNQDNEIVV